MPVFFTCVVPPDCGHCTVFLDLQYPVPRAEYQWYITRWLVQVAHAPIAGAQTVGRDRGSRLLLRDPVREGSGGAVAAM